MYEMCRAARVFVAYNIVHFVGKKGDYLRDTEVGYKQIGWRDRRNLAL